MQIHVDQNDGDVRRSLTALDRSDLAEAKSRIQAVLDPELTLTLKSPTANDFEGRGQDSVGAACRHEPQAQRLKREFTIDMESFWRCGGTVLQIHRESRPSNDNVRTR